MTIPLLPRTARIFALSLLMFAVLSQPGTANAESWTNLTSRNTPEGRACLLEFGAIACNHARDAAGWASRVATWRCGHNGHNDAADAFRHCAAAGALSTRVGSSAATRIGQIHEDHHPNPDAERLMDVGNNAVGARIGRDAVNRRLPDTWGYVMNTCESRARGYRLHGLWGIQGNYRL